MNAFQTIYSKRYSFLAMLLLSMVSMLTFTACGGDDADEDNFNIKESEQTMKVYAQRKLEITFTGDIKSWQPSMSFLCTASQGSDGTLIVDGEKYKEGSLVWDPEDVKKNAIVCSSVSSDCTLLTCMITFMGDSPTGTMKVSYKEYEDGKLVR